MKVQMAGPSAPQHSAAHGVSRSVNLYPALLEGAGERAVWGLRDFPGLIASPWGLSGEMRGALDVDGRVFAVVGNTLWELFADGTKANRYTMPTSSGRVGMVWNTTQVVFSDGIALYAMTRATNAVTVSAFPGSARIAYIDQYIIFRHRETQQFGWTALGDATSIDSLDFASAEGSPDKMRDLIGDHRELILFGTMSGEVWATVGGTDAFARNGGAFFEVGAAAEFIAHQLAGSTVWLGSNGRVFRLDGYREVAISKDWVEAKLDGLDLSGAKAYTVEFGGHAFYCLNVPGIDTTLAYDAKTGEWSELADMVDGDYVPYRGVFSFRAFGKLWLAGSDGVLYEMSMDAHDNAGDELVRDRIFEVPLDGDSRVRFGRFVLTCDTGYGGTAMLRYTTAIDELAAQSWRVASLGAIGQRNIRVKWERTGSARRRIWHVRVTDAVPFNPVAAEVM